MSPPGWPFEQEKELGVLFLAGLGDDEIAEALTRKFGKAFSRNHVIGKRSRLGLFRRRGALPDPAKQSGRIGSVSLDFDRNIVSRDGTSIKLSAAEAEVLYVLLECAPQTASFTAIIRGVWGVLADRKDRYDGLKKYVSTLRLKLSAIHCDVRADRNQGYRLIVNESAEATP